MVLYVFKKASHLPLFTDPACPPVATKGVLSTGKSRG